MSTLQTVLRLELKRQPRENWITQIHIAEGVAEVGRSYRAPTFEVDVKLEPLRPEQFKAQFDALVYGSALNLDEKLYLRELALPLAPGPRVTPIARKCPQLMVQLRQLKHYAGRVTVRSVEELFEALRIRQSRVFDPRIIWGSLPRPADYAFRMYQDNGDLTPTYINPRLRNQIEDPRNPDLVVLWAYYQKRQLWSEAQGPVPTWKSNRELRNLQHARAAEDWTDGATSSTPNETSATSTNMGSTMPIVTDGFVYPTSIIYERIVPEDLIGDTSSTNPTVCPFY